MIAQPVLLGIDIGTTNFKIVAVTPQGETLVVVRRAMVIDRPSPGAAGFNIPALNRHLVEGLRELVTQLGPGNLGNLAAVSVTSIGESFLGVDANGEVITPCPAWYDRRTVPRQQAIPLEAACWYNITGMVDDDIYTACRLWWWRRQSADHFRRVRRWLMVADYVVYLLSGNYVTSPSLAARSGLADRHHGCWSPTLLQALSLSEQVLPQLKAAAQTAGVLNRQMAALSGLPAGLPVIHAGHDHPCAGFGCGLVDSGQFIDSTGTSEALKTVVTRPLSWQEVGNGDYDCYPHVIPGCWLLSGHIPSSGSFLDWLVRMLSGPSPQPAQRDWLWQQAAASPAGAQGVRVAPFLEGSGAPWNQRDARASLTAIGDDCAAGDLLRAGVESLAAWLEINFTRFMQITGQSTDALTLTGGGARQTLSNQIKAAMLQKTCLIPQVEEAAGLGAALVGGLAVGVFDTAHQAAQRPAILQQTLSPDARLSAQYAALRPRLTDTLQLRKSP
ncbi:hypothetical protein BL250_11040 [Erwinia sp. OLTSP20]|uniref:FGGY-family carbohydrate kinase n=1 Tax=unclassified Erwinia TaxID=2622719 RepID=UPI000C1768EF|nr:MULTISPECIES: FGGY-family carbohydrate kinase [unclassified Erwinia]PIJ50299.1 hypothetical protein BV501_09550 [Erwinia sp. OAMSP11]PIJ72137.1 hypothetical protein BK416_10445 [Erwinia sp. OLSSP12]PIJ81428.1 hypothetical protein BLD47_09270 [Erwinia sp. OLCASP19]PIJ84134.1 hypothetical protein BLD46_08850 [Erwinia sp. OLMTSP26]PIJ85833.1 hypothetical protein BLD49_10070 [Erwinia sp. OLMDSP33]